MTYAVSIPMFTGVVHMGAAQTKIDVVYDTGSDWLVIPDSNCASCDGTKHDNSDAVVTDASQSERHYGSASLAGRTYKDKVCLTLESTSCVPDFEYFSFN